MSLGNEKLQVPRGFMEMTVPLIIAAIIKLFLFLLYLCTYCCMYPTSLIAITANTYTMCFPFLLDSSPGSLVLESVLFIICLLHNVPYNKSRSFQGFTLRGGDV